MIITLLILTMLWLTSCAVCTAVGFFIGKNFKKARPPVEAVLNDIEKQRSEQAKRETENFFAYDGSEQSDSVNTQ